MPRIPSTPPAALMQASEVFERWRSRRKTSRIPKALWRRASELACQYGVNRTSRILRLNYSDLKRRAEVPGSSAGRSSTAASPFVEISPVSNGAAECVVELERYDGGKMRIQFKGTSAPDLASLSRAFWGAPK